MAHLEFEKPIVDLENRIRDLRALAGKDAGIEAQLSRLVEQVEKLRRDIYADLTVWQKVQLSRHPDRPYFLDYLERLFDDFVELHGDRAFGDDASIVAGFARFRGRPIALIGQQKGRSTKEKVRRNFGMAHPEGYRKACRVMELADRFRRPVLTFIDTPGAYPGIGAEERGQSEAIGHAILLMSKLRVPSVATVLGEGGSGGALALGVASWVAMMEFGTYSVISPEGCASILWHDGGRAPAAAEQLRLLSGDALRLGVVDEVVSEPVGGAHRDADAAAEQLGATLERALDRLCAQPVNELQTARYEKFRTMGRYLHAS